MNGQKFAAAVVAALLVVGAATGVALAAAPRGDGPGASVAPAGAVAAGTGGAGSVGDSADVELRAGFNLVSWLGADDVPVADAVAPLGAAFAALFRWDAEAQAFHSYAAGVPPALNTVRTLRHGDALWVRVTDPLIWPGSGAALNCGAGAEGTVPFEDADVFIEFNDADQDVGFHGAFDSPGWTVAVICSPDGEALFTLQAGGSTLAHGLSELFFEGAEPPLAVQPLDEFLDRFPEGEYVVLGQTVDGEMLRSVTEFTHDIPAAPVILSPEEDAELAMDAVVIAWEPVTSPLGVEIDGYEVTVSAVGPAEGEGDPALPIDLALRLPADVTEFRVPAELLAPSTVYEFEVLSIEESGNKTISAGEFATPP